MQRSRAASDDGFHVPSLGALGMRAVASMPRTSLLVVDADLRVHAVAGAALARAGLTRERAVGRPVADVLPARLLVQVTRRLAWALSGAETYDDGCWGEDGVAHETSYSPVRGEDGGVLGAVALVREVASERRALDAVTASLGLRRDVTDHAGDVLATFDGRGRFAWVSESVTRVTGWTPGELVGRRAYELLHPEDERETRRRLTALYQGLDETTAHYRYLHRDGGWVRFEARVRALPGQRGAVRGLVSTARQVPLAAPPSPADSPTDSAFELVPTGMALVAPDGRLTRTNAALRTLLGRDAADLGARSLQELAEQPGQVAELLHGDRDSYSLETGLRRGDGTLARVALSVQVARAPGGAAQLFVVQVDDLSARHSAHDELVRRASSDPLTGLPNRNVLFDRLRHALAAAPRRGAQVAVVFVDLDGFKAVNDSYGHAAGDEVLRQVAARLRRAVREEDTVARLGGDEFVVLSEAVTDPRQVEVLVDRLQAAVLDPVQLPQGPVRVGLTTGVAMGSSAPAEELVRRADAAMYARKPARVVDLR
ncbi:PAS domain S-box-containing protein/diguanylate cyclase (GGDEF)-like protein [Motilibacter peucedani]|uniref:PAS domain S-box-containing protein/diguanylate cyclase (GGDEF)-like protein n=1 Tax=Motilibacter peucedani TaxID=598650 RepID=A0A420XQ87_9ACTN|nr:diguanylate cyclase [Motilibacter peucedani]RKS75414.1 PAS domain S-box-containing protein/diguanylate cyclase (GGDEF)-like protein [Motilibacter peucedani]